MNSVHINRFAALALLLAAATSHAAAQSLVVSPSTVTLTSAVREADVVVTTQPAIPVAAQFTILGLPSWLALDLVNTSGYSTGGTYRFRLIPENLANTTSATVTFISAGLTSAAVTVTVEGVIGGGIGITPSPSSLSFTPADPGPKIITLLTNTLDMPTYSLSVMYHSGLGWLTVSPPLQTFTASPDITVQANPAGLEAGSYTAALRLTRADTGQTLNIPITLTIGGSPGRVLTPNPSEIVLSGAQSQVNLTVVPSTAEPVPYTLSLSPELDTLRQQGYLSVVAPAQIAAAGSTFTFSLFEAATLPATAGTLSLIPRADTGYATLTIPFSINSTGPVPGSIISGTPTALSFDGILGGERPPAKTISVTSNDIFNPSQVFTAVVTAGSTWLTVTPTTGFTPRTLSVQPNPAAVATSGTHNGNIALQTIAGVTVQNIPVIMNVTQPFTVSVSPNLLNLTGAAGGSTTQGTVQVTSVSGAPNPPITTSVTTNSGGEWLSVVSSSATLPATLTIAANPASLAIGTYTGNVAVVSGGTAVANIPVTLRVIQAATLQLSVSTLTFTHQTTSASGPPAQTVQVTSSTPGVNWSATATSSGNWLQVAPATGTTPGTLSVSVNPAGLQPNTYTGTISVSSPVASNSPRTITVTLTVVTPGPPQVTSVVNSASLRQDQSVAVPGMIFTIFGTDLGPATGVSGTIADGMLGTTLEGVRVLFDGTPAPLLYVSANQINGVMPFELVGRLTTRMRVEYRGVASAERELQVTDVAPGLYTEAASGFGQAAALNQDGSFNNAANPEARGNVIVLYATGLGQTNPAGVTGQVATAVGSLVATPVSVTIGGVEAQVQYAGPAPGLISGGVQINAVIPQGAPTGAVPVTVQVASGSSQSNVTVSVR